MITQQLFLTTDPSLKIYIEKMWKIVCSVKFYILEENFNQPQINNTHLFWLFKISIIHWLKHTLYILLNTHVLYT